MSQIHFIGGEKGGVGKSFFARELIYYLNLRKFNYFLIDSDKSNPDVAARYPAARKIFFSEVDKKSTDADEIFNLALEQPVFVNLPGQIEQLVNGWIDRNGLIDEFAKDFKLEIYKWFTCTGWHESLMLFIQSVEKAEGKIKHVFVKNQVFADEEDWERIFEDYPRLGELINQYSIPQVVVPKLLPREGNLIDRNQWTFDHAVNSDNSEIQVLSKQRVIKCLGAVVRNLDELGILTADSFKTHSVKPKKANA